MEGWLTVSAIYIGLALEAMALVIIGIGSVKVFVAGISTMVFKSSSHDEIRSVWLDYARWLIAGLTFQLAADLVHTTVAPTWDDIGRLAAIAVTRTFLSNATWKIFAAEGWEIYHRCNRRRQAL
jgi:uncharacterized membrane protein